LTEGELLVLLVYFSARSAGRGLATHYLDGDKEHLIADGRLSFAFVLSFLRRQAALSEGRTERQGGNAM
jgi:hypothetical protein